MKTELEKAVENLAKELDLKFKYCTGDLVEIIERYTFDLVTEGA